MTDNTTSTTSLYNDFLRIHKNQLINSNVPQHYWPTLHHKLTTQTFDIGSAVHLLQIDYYHQDDDKRGNVQRPRESHEPVWCVETTKTMAANDPQHIYLIDHAWTFRLAGGDKDACALNQLTGNPALCVRLGRMLGLDEDTATPQTIFDRIWTICHTYSINDQFTDDNSLLSLSVDDRLPIWYVMDEIGSALVHSDTPNCRFVPFFYANDSTTYSLLYPDMTIDVETYLSCDFAYGITDPLQRAAVLLPWMPSKGSNLFENVSIQPSTPGPDYYLSGHIAETLPIDSEGHLKVNRPLTGKYRVYSEYSLVNRYLTDSRFELVDSETDNPNILWLTRHFRDYRELSIEQQQNNTIKFVNQFPYEYVLTVKDLLCLICRNNTSCSKDHPDGTLMTDDSILPTTYNLKTELANFVKYYWERAAHALDNHWIIKPYNLARGLDTHITANLNCIVRLALTSGPKICQKYITRPVLFNRTECAGAVKFDIRYIIIVKRTRPTLSAYVHKQFYLRFANRPFALDEFDVYEKHFTVMNYRVDNPLRHMRCDDEFQSQWIEQYPDHRWGDDVEVRVLEMLRKVLECATAQEPPLGIGGCAQSRALYAADLMLEWVDEKQDRMQPKLLEVNWMPDCQRACEYYPNFYNDCFQLMFLDDDDESNNYNKNVFHKL